MKPQLHDQLLHNQKYLGASNVNSSNMFSDNNSMGKQNFHQRMSYQNKNNYTNLQKGLQSTSDNATPQSLYQSLKQSQNGPKFRNISQSLNVDKSKQQAQFYRKKEIYAQNNISDQQSIYQDEGTIGNVKNLQAKYRNRTIVSRQTKLNSNASHNI